MIKEINVNSMNQLIDETVPENIRLKPHQKFTHKDQKIHSIDSYNQIMEHMRHLASLNK